MSPRAHKQGFTLIEIIAVLVILVIAAAAVVPTMSGYITESQQRARDQVARTIFMAAQTALTQKYNQDRNFFESESVTTQLRLDEIVPADSITEQERTKQGKLVLLVSNPDNPSDKLISWLDPQINDKEVLNQAIAVEYNRETGRVLSAFYTEKEINEAHVKLGYGGGSFYNVYNRDRDALAAGFVGYYGVASTGDPIRSNLIDSEAYSVLLRDYTVYNDGSALPYGVLTAEITLPIAGLNNELAYKLTLMPTEGENESFTFSDAPNISADFELSGVLMQHRNIDDAMDAPHESGGRRVVSYFDEATGKLIIVLDCVQSYGTYSMTDNLSIRTNYPGILGGYLDAALEITDGADTVVRYSDDEAGSERVHALYGGMESGDGNASVYSISSIRHLNNIRYNADPNAVFTQDANIYFYNYKGEKLNFTPLCNAHDPAKNDAGDYGFVGRFRNSGYTYAMVDMTVDLDEWSELALENAGLFDTVRGAVSGVKFISTDAGGQVLPATRGRTASVTGLNAAGGIAAVNRGTISNCTVLGEVIALSTDGAAGGIAGQNSGMISGSTVAAHVKAPSYAGGIAGTSVGTVQRCEVGTASWRTTDDSTDLFLTGLPYYGAHADGAYSYIFDRTANNTFIIEGTSDGGVTGGIVGLLAGDGTVSGCLNAAKVESGGGSNDDTIAGGVVGYIALDGSNPGEPVVSNCSNAGAIYAPDVAGGIVGRMSCGRLQHSYNSGYINRQFEAVVVCGVSYIVPGLAINMNDSVSAYKFGGILGYGSGADIEVDDCYSAQYSGNRYGGAFGIMNKSIRSSQITKCSFLKNGLNDTDIFYTETGPAADPQPMVESYAHIYSEESLRLAPFNGGLDDTVFRDGNKNGVGVFGYTYPVFTDSTGFHRTPYRRMVLSYGKLSSFARIDTHIEAKFMLTPADGKITFTVVPNSGSEFTINVPLQESDFVALHAHVGDPMYIDGTGTNGQDYTFYGKAEQITDPDSLYPYQYTIYLNYRSEDDDDLPEFTRLTAKIYNTYFNSGRSIVDEMSLATALSLMDVTAADGTVGRALRIDTVPGSNGAVDIKLNYDGATFPTQEIKLSGINSSPASFDAALADPNSWHGFSNSDHRFPFYITGSGTNRVMYLVLWLNGDASHDKPNGLNSVSTPVEIETKVNGKTYREVYSKLEP